VFVCVFFVCVCGCVQVCVCGGGGGGGGGYVGRKGDCMREKTWYRDSVDTLDAASEKYYKAHGAVERVPLSMATDGGDERQAERVS
jgi:hypothetical protein